MQVHYDLLLPAAHGIVSGPAKSSAPINAAACRFTGGGKRGPPQKREGAMRTGDDERQAARREPGNAAGKRPFLMTGIRPSVRDMATRSMFTAEPYLSHRFGQQYVDPLAICCESSYDWTCDGSCEAFCDRSCNAGGDASNAHLPASNAILYLRPQLRPAARLRSGLRGHNVQRVQSRSRRHACSTGGCGRTAGQRGRA